MEEARCVDDVNLAIQLSESRTSSVIEYISDKEFALERVSITEKIISQIYEFGSQICSKNVFARCSIRNQLADVLRKAAADVQESFVRFLETTEDGEIEGREGNGKVKEAALAYAGIRKYVPGAISLIQKRSISVTLDLWDV